MGTKDYTEGDADIVNFRILPDGTLKKRSAYRKLSSLPTEIRAVWAGKLDGESAFFALAGNNVYFIEPDSGASTLISKIPNSGKRAEFFYYQCSLFLIDGSEIYSVSKSDVRFAVGYAPLIGKDWREDEIGKINEPRNILTRRARITYLIEKSTASTLYTDGAVSSIEAVYVNGALLSSDKYMISSTPGIVIVSGLKQNDRVELYFTYASGISAENLKANTRAAVFGGISNSRPFLFGGDDGAVMYSGAHVSGSSLADCRKVYPDSDAIYFPLAYEFTVGDGRYPICAVGRHFDRLLIFTEGGVWMADSSSCGIEDFPVMSINTSTAIVSHGSIAMMGNSPCAVGKNGVYAYTANTDELDECNAYSISDSVLSFLSEDILKNGGLYHHGKTDELLLYSPGTDTVWAYSVPTSRWTRYTGLHADRFFDLEGEAAFTDKESIFVFDESLGADENERNVQAYVLTHPISFSTARKKRLSYAAAEFSGGDISEELYFDGEDAPSLSLSLRGDEKIDPVRRKRISARRFNSVSAKISADGLTQQRIISARLGTK